MLIRSPLNRVVVVLFLAGCALGLAGCDVLDPRVPSPFTGEPVTEAGLVREVMAREAEAKAEAKFAAEVAAQEIREAQAEARRASIDLAQRQATTAAELTAEAAMVEAETGQKIAAATAAIDAAAKALEQRLAIIVEQGDAAAAELAAKREKWAGIGRFVAGIPGVQSAMSTVGVDVNAALNVLLGGGMLYQMRRRKKDADANYAEGVAEGRASAEAVRQAADAAWDAAQAQLFALHAPPPAKASS